MDSVTATVVGALLGGVLTVIGGLLATLWLARLERDREQNRQRARHATAVRIVVLEVQNNCAALIAGRWPPDLYSLLPAALAADIAFAYGVATSNSATAIRKLLRRKGIGPAPLRSRQTWKAFFCAGMNSSTWGVS